MKQLLLRLITLGAALITGATAGLGQTPKTPTEIRFACSTGGDDLKRLRREVQEFESLNPDIRVRVEPIVDNYETKLLSMLAANTAPDVAVVSPNRYVMYASRGALHPLDAMPGIDGPEVDLADRYPNILNAFRYSGELFAIPRDIACSAHIYYNRKLFREAGIPYPDGTWTWETKVRPEVGARDFIWVMQQLTNRSQGQFGFATAWPQLWMDTLLTSSDVRMWDSDIKPTRLLLTDPKVVEIFRFASDCINKHHWIPSNNEITLGAGSTMQDQFRKGKIAMLQSGAWEIKDMRLKMKGEWDIAPFPRFARATTNYLPGEGAGLAIFRSSTKKEAAWRWIKWYCGKPGLTSMARAADSFPSLRSLAKKEGVWLPRKSETGSKSSPASLAITLTEANRVRYRALPEYFRAGIAEDIQGAFYGVLSGENDPEIALRKLQSDSPKRLALALRRIERKPYPVGVGVGVAVGLVALLLGWIYLPERKIGFTRSQKAENRSAYLFLLPWLVGLGFTVGPMIYSLLLSFAESDIIQPASWRGLGNYADLFNPDIDDTLWISVRQTFLYSVLSIPLGTGFALALAVLLNQNVKGVPLFRALYYLPSLASAVAMSLIWMRLFDKDRGLINQLLFWPRSDGSYAGIGPWVAQWVGSGEGPINWLGNTKTVIPAFIIMGLWGAGGGTIIFLAGLQGISTSYHEAATLDGASHWKRFWKVTLPLLTPTLFFSLITGVIGSLQVFSQSFVMTDGGPDRATMFYMVWLWKTAFGQLRMGYASAQAWVLFVIILVFTLVQLAFARRWVHYEGDLKA